MHVLLPVKGKSQHASTVHERYRNSACGPTTAHVIVTYLAATYSLTPLPINRYYKILKTTKIGLFTWRFIHHLQKHLGNKWIVQSCTVAEALLELNEGRPVAMKFDKYFTFNFFKNPMYAYHWVVLLGYELKNEDLYLFIHDNGGPGRESKIRTVRYIENKSVLSFIQIRPKEKL